MTCLDDSEPHCVRSSRLGIVREEPSAAILTIGNELVSGDVPSSNGTWLAKRLAPLGFAVHLIASIPDELDRIVEWIHVEAPRADVVLVTGGLGGTPDDITREALAAAFAVEQVELPELADDLRSRFPNHPEYVARWANLPAGSRPLRNPLGGAPGFALENVYVLPGLPTEMEAMFLALESELDGGLPIRSWRCRYETGESRIAALLEEAVERWPIVLVGSYPSFQPGGATVEVVLKSRNAEALEAASTWLDPRLAETARPAR